jgi:hypothetical protein
VKKLVAGRTVAGSYMMGFFRLQANVVDVVAQVEKRVFNHAVGKQFMALSHEA